MRTGFLHGIAVTIDRSGQHYIKRKTPEQAYTSLKQLIARVLDIDDGKTVRFVPHSIFSEPHYAVRAEGDQCTIVIGEDTRETTNIICVARWYAVSVVDINEHPFLQEIMDGN